MNTDYQAQLEEIVSMLQEDSSIGLDLNHKADQYRREKNWEKAEEYADRSIQLCQDIKDKHAAGFGLLRKGIIYHAQGRLQDAIRLYQASLEAFVNDRHNKAVVYFALGIAYHELSNWRETLKNYRVSMRISHGLDDLLYSMVEKRWRQAVELSGGGVKGVGEEVEVVEEKDKERKAGVKEVQQPPSVPAVERKARTGEEALLGSILELHGARRIALILAVSGLVGGLVGQIAMSLAGHVGFNAYVSFLVTFPITTLLLTTYFFRKTHLPLCIKFGRVAVVEHRGQPRIAEAGRDVFWIPFLDQMRAIVPTWEFCYICPQQKIFISPRDQLDVNVQVCYRVEHPVRATYYFCGYGGKKNNGKMVGPQLLLEEDMKRMWERQLFSDILLSLKRAMWGVTIDDLSKNREDIEAQFREKLNRRTHEWGIFVTEVLLEAHLSKEDS